MEHKGQITFIDYGSDDFSPFYDTIKSPHTKGFWFLVGIKRTDGNNTLLACDSENIENLLKESECCRISQLHGRDIFIDEETRKVNIIK
jgi:hypothetical protein